MASRTAISNRALTKVGAARIIDLTDDTPQARAVDSMYDIERRALLRGHRWNFAMRRASLPALAEAPTWGFDFQFQLPADCLRVDMVGDLYYFPVVRSYVTAPGQPWMIEGARIMTDLPAPLVIRYVADTEEEQDVIFDTALSCKLAIELLETVTQGGTEKRKVLHEEFKMAINEAKRVNAIENPPDPIPDNSWLLGRLGTP